jgi:hypothetical protein
MTTQQYMSADICFTNRDDADHGLAVLKQNGFRIGITASELNSGESPVWIHAVKRTELGESAFLNHIADLLGGTKHSIMIEAGQTRG